jgi:transposase
MSASELKRVEVLGRVSAGTLSLGSAATMLAVSYRQAKRLWRRFRDEGARGLRHRSAGRPSNRGTSATTRARVLALIREKYSGDAATRFGPTLAAEHLASEDGISVPRETLRRWMRSEGLWSPARARSPHRQRRERKAHFGELVQLDGSFHAWFEDRGPQRCLMTLVDDATGRSLGRLGAQETIWAAAAVLRSWIEQYGSPVALYTDWKNVYVRKPTADERLTGIAPLTQFGRMCATLGIQIIPASSPQAKGRVERHHGTHQDRLVKKLRRKGLHADDAANAFLEAAYFAEHNRRFAVAPRSADDFHVPVPPGVRLEDVFRLEETRVLGNDWVVRYHNRFLQVERQSGHAPARSHVQVCEWPDGRLAIQYRERPVVWRELPASPAAAAPVRPVLPPRPIADGAFAYRRPSIDHPWRRRAEERDVPIWQARDR